VAIVQEFDNLFSLSGRTAVITGGASGLGRMIAEGFLRAGARVVITSRKADACSAAQDELSELGDCRAIPLDLSGESAARDFAAKVADLFDSLDILVNNAGRTWSAPIDTFPEKAWLNVLTVNLVAPFKLTQSLLPMLERGASAADPSRIINIGSIAGRVVEPIQAYSYSSSKAAAHHLTRQLAAELATRHITVNTLAPGYFRTTMTSHLQNQEGEPAGILDGHIPVRRFGRPADIAGAAIFLSSRAGAYVTGTELVIDGGVSGCR
jgi:NAD(P)-dependent dehydrogenase (short-subunit alcohol dehydrogenase family)